MSKKSRLCYHAVPRVMKADVTWLSSLPITESSPEANSIQLDTETDDSNPKRRKLDNNGNVMDDSVWNSIMDAKFWRPFAVYLSGCRININVRQVLEWGENRLEK